jgi:hypothetical protein
MSGANRAAMLRRTESMFRALPQLTVSRLRPSRRVIAGAPASRVRPTEDAPDDGHVRERAC